MGSWLGARLRAADQGHGLRQRRALAVDGKAVRGTRHSSSDGQAVHLLGVIDQQARAVLAQAAVDGKTNEITQFAPLLEDLDITGAVITADALHTQRQHAKFLVSDKKAHYILVVKKNQPTLYAQVKNLPGATSRPAATQRDRGRGREEHRTLKAAAVTTGLAFPHAAQAIRVTRRIRRLETARRNGGPSPSTPLRAWATGAQATDAQLAADGYAVTGRSRALHHIRDVTYGEDASQTRTGNGPQVMATLRNLSIGIFKMAGHTSIATACRHHARDATRTLATLELSPP